MKCPNCKRECGYPDFTTRSTYLWANQHGTCSRVFCGQCGQWTDIKEIYKTGATTQRIVRPAKENVPVSA